MKHSAIQTIKALVLAILIVVGVSVASASWISNTSTVVSAPITTGAIDEVKLGGLSVGTFLANLNSGFSSSVVVKPFKTNVGVRQLCVDTSNGRLFLGPTATTCQ